MNPKNTTLDKALDILYLFREKETSLSATDIAIKLNFPRSTTYRFIHILKNKGLLEAIGQGLYQPGWLVLELTRVVGMRTNLADVSIPVMQRLSWETKETVVMTIPFGLKAKVLTHIESPWQLKLSYKMGQERSLHKGAPSKIILANLSENYQRFVFEVYKKEWDILSLKRELKLIKEQGFVVTSNEVDEGARGISAPIFRPNNTLAAGINVAGPLTRIDNHRLPKIIHLVKNAAQEITEMLAEI